MHLKNKKIMKSKFVIFAVGMIIVSSCKSTKDLTLIKVKNDLDSKIYIELWGYPAKDYKDNKAGAFDGIVKPNNSFIIELKESDLYIKTPDISPVYDTSEYAGFEIFIYKPIGEEIVIFGDTPKDTLYFEKIDLKNTVVR